MNESIFSYGVTVIELENLHLQDAAENQYLQSTLTHNRLYDLYNLFKIRKDELAANNLWVDSIMSDFIVKPVLFYN